MTRSIHRLTASLALAAGITLAPFAMAPSAKAPTARAQGRLSGEEARVLDEVRSLIRDVELESANTLLLSLEASTDESPDVLDARALLAIHTGEYERAAKAAAEAARLRGKSSAPAGAKDLLTLSESTMRATASLKEHRSADGRYRVFVAAGADELLVPYALEALGLADKAISAVLGHSHPGPIRLEIYDSAERLAQVSNLSVTDIERTGTIALSKWDRVMITSPRALVRGYPWIDTIAHEVVHLTLSRATRDRSPVWFQEGVAKFLERRWRADNATGALQLDASQERMLSAAAKAGKLIPFEKLHPSIARLPSQEDAALAFAQVSTLIERAVRIHGESVLKDAAVMIRQGTDAKGALAQAASTSWQGLEADWRASLGARKVPPETKARPYLRRFRQGANEDESLDVSERQARSHVRLGDMLYARNRKGGAATEYARARKYASDDPIIASRLGRSAVEAGDGAAAVKALLPLLERYGEFAPMHAILGRAYALLGKDADAVRSFEEALWLNPFDPEPHCGLAQLAGEQSVRTREQVACRALGK
jgi:Flp pilus assembly protein TadD